MLPRVPTATIGIETFCPDIRTGAIGIATSAVGMERRIPAKTGKAAANPALSHRRKTMKILVGAGLLGMVFMSAGCCVFSSASRETSAQELRQPAELDYVHELSPADSVAKISTKPHLAVHFDEVAVLQEGDKLVVRGALHPRSFANTKVGHVDIRVFGASGKLLRDFKAVPDRAVFSRDSEFHPHFLATTDLIVPEGASVQLRYHEGSVDACSDIE
jgi:hypothetical protein